MIGCHHRKWRTYAPAILILGLYIVGEEPTFADPIWQNSQLLTPVDLAPSDHFGTSVAIDANTAVVSTYRWEDEGGQGYAYVYRKSPSQTWNEVAKLSPTDVTRPGFGTSVAVSGNSAIVGGP